MATRREMYQKSKGEFETLRTAWKTLFPVPESDVSIPEHFPPAINHLLDRILQEFTDSLDEAVREACEETPDLEMATVGWTVTMTFVKNLSVQFYQLGQYLSKELPYDGLAPCPCAVVTDDEIRELLEGE